MLENRHVAADFTDAAQRGDPQSARGERTWRAELVVHLRLTLWLTAAPTPRACRWPAPPPAAGLPASGAAAGPRRRCPAAADPPWPSSPRPDGSSRHTAVRSQR